MSHTTNAAPQEKCAAAFSIRLGDPRILLPSVPWQSDRVCVFFFFLFFFFCPLDKPSTPALASFCRTLRRKSHHKQRTWLRNPHSHASPAPRVNLVLPPPRTGRDSVPAGFPPRSLASWRGRPTRLRWVVGHRNGLRGKTLD
ncbi:hypothetical protein LY78DRAFT_471857 [Colletotrichum sublineola]|nr:hypothetical protein LY78DRAFT_471857 [Colletotrichum sublineola]